jgi:hypothetical protein
LFRSRTAGDQFRTGFVGGIAMLHFHLFLALHIRLGILLSLLLLLAGQAKGGRKDLVTLKNGDRITGEIKRLDRGVLYIDLDYVSSTVGLDWRQIEKVETGAVYQIVLEHGDHLIGTFAKLPSTDAGVEDVAIHLGDQKKVVPASSIVQIESQKESFWRQLTGGVSVGASFTSGNSQTAVNTSANTKYVARLWSAGASFTSSFSGQADASKTNLQDVQAGADRSLSQNSFLLALSDFLHSSQQQLNLRTTLGGGFGRYVIRRNGNELRWFGGTVYTHEDFESASSSPTQENVEGLAGMDYSLYRFDKYSLTSQFLLYPGFSDLGRVRATTKTSFSIKLPNNFNLTFSFWDNYDSRPPVTARKNEFGVSNSIGWTF